MPSHCDECRRAKKQQDMNRDGVRFVSTENLVRDLSKMYKRGVASSEETEHTIAAKIKPRERSMSSTSSRSSASVVLRVIGYSVDEPRGL